MKTYRNILFVLLFTALTAACEQGPRSGPIADAPEVEGREVLYSVEGPQSAAKVGASEPVALQIKAAPGWKINKLFDWNFDFQPTDSAELLDTNVSGDEIVLEDARATIPVTLTAKTEGDIKLSASADFSICNDDKCELYRDVQLTFVVPATRP